MLQLLGGRGAVFAALALGALTSYIAWRYVDQANQQPSHGVEMAPVVVANVRIPPRAVITPDMVRVQPMPVEAVHPQSTHSVDEVVGKITRADMVPDEPVLSSRLFLQRGESGLAFMIPDGMRAVSVNFTELIGSGGMVVPGDHVDVIGVFDAKPDPKDPKIDRVDQVTIANIVLQNVQVLAVAQRLEGEDTSKKDQGPVQLPGAAAQQPPATQVRSDPSPQPAAKTATLAVSPQDALKIVLAEEKGKIRLALRRTNDKSMAVVAEVPITALLSPTPMAVASVPAQ
jgi:pilus assembly protein CpaB